MSLVRKGKRFREQVLSLVWRLALLGGRYDGIHAPPPTPQPASKSARSGSRSGTSSSWVAPGRFLPGTILADRYRIVALLGRGGMGEVYRADDLTLYQPVALKFLPEATARDEDALERFHNEVRIARRISHPNVCRIYDIGQADA
jgi:serine/threonine-protein kinase